MRNNGLKIILKQNIKMFVQRYFLPFVYTVYKNKEIDKRSIIFSDTHNNSMPFSMQYLYDELKEKDYDIHLYFLDYNQATFYQILKNMVGFMKCYASARFVFICDYHVPVTSCKKKNETTVIQLWHACGAYKKFGYSTSEDISPYYKGNPFLNYDIFTVSSKKCVDAFKSAIKDKDNVVQAVGISRTDYYFNDAYINKCKEKFSKYYPEANNKKIVLWAPTFRGDASDPTLYGMQEMKKAAQALNEEYYFIWSLHPHLYKESDERPRMRTEELIVVSDVLITDYSSVLFEFFMLKKPVILFAKDFEEYTSIRGFYLDIHEIPAPLIVEGNKLKDTIANIEDFYDKDKVEKFNYEYMENCDGKVTERIIQKLKI